jgi:hypothetical protein
MIHIVDHQCYNMTTNTFWVKPLNKPIRRLIQIFDIVLILAVSIASSEVVIPSTGGDNTGFPYTTSPLETKLAFIKSVVNGKSDDIVGLWLPGYVGLIVEKQPEGQPGYLSDSPSVVTRFQLADEFGSIGLLAHAHQAGIVFHALLEGQIVTLIYGDGTEVEYRIEEIRQYQALDSGTPQSDFISVLPDSKRVSQEELFYEVYAQPGRLVLQTCIIKENNNLWGRKFIIASKK